LSRVDSVEDEIWTLSFTAPVSILQPGLTASYQYTGSLPDFSDTKNGMPASGLRSD